MLFNNLMVILLMVVSAIAVPAPEPKKGGGKGGKDGDVDFPKDSKDDGQSKILKKLLKPKKKKKQDNSREYVCVNSSGKFVITQPWARTAVVTGGTVAGTSSFPHQFYGKQGDGGSSGTQLRFIGGDPRCNMKNPELLEFPVAKNGIPFDKNKERDTTTPARVVYLKNDPRVLCGVMTHIAENRLTGHGSGDFRVCDLKRKVKGQ